MFKLLNIFSVISALLLIGIFACVVHIIPQSHHTADSHAEPETNHVTCVDHEETVYFSHKDQGELGQQVAIVPSTSIESMFVSNIDFIYLNTIELYSPPNKTPLYIKNNTFVI